MVVIYYFIDVTEKGLLSVYEGFALKESIGVTNGFSFSFYFILIESFVSLKVAL